jgi:hypothetical protein
MSDALYVQSHSRRLFAAQRQTATTRSKANRSSRREDVSDKAKANLKPDSEKSTLEKGQEQVQGAADSVAGSLQPCTSTTCTTLQPTLLKEAALNYASMTNFSTSRRQIRDATGN